MNSDIGQLNSKRRRESSVIIVDNKVHRSQEDLTRDEINYQQSKLVYYHRDKGTEEEEEDKDRQ